jgi:hypothetical protein
MTETRTPLTGTIDMAIAGAWLFVEQYPTQGASNESRVMYHALIHYLRELGVSKDDVQKIRELIWDAEFAEFDRGWAKGWEAGEEFAKDRSAPPF